MGLTFQHTNGFFGKVSEKTLVKIWGPRLGNIPSTWLILADKGFDKTSGCYPNYNTVLHPAFLHGKKQFTKRELKYRATLAHEGRTPGW